MKLFKVKGLDLQFLISHISSRSLRDIFLKALDDGHIKAKSQYPTGWFIVEMEDRDVSEVLNELSRLLTSIGLRKEDEPNAIGLRIESLIDLFNF